MNRLKLFDTVKLTQGITTYQGDNIPQNTIGTVVEVYNGGEAYEVELFGDWVKYDCQGDIIPSNIGDPQAFTETIAVETLYPEQIMLIKDVNQAVNV